MSKADTISAFEAYHMAPKKNSGKKQKNSVKHKSSQQQISKTPVEKLLNGFEKEGTTLKMSKNAKRKLKNRMLEISTIHPKDIQTNIMSEMKNGQPSKKRSPERELENSPPNKKGKLVKTVQQNKPLEDKISEPVAGIVPIQKVEKSTPTKKGKPNKTVQQDKPVKDKATKPGKGDASHNNIENSSPSKKEKLHKSVQQSKPVEAKRNKSGTDKYIASNSQPKNSLKSSIDIDPPTNDSVEDGKEVFRWLISPVDFDEFFEKFWEKKPCLIQRNDSSYFSKLISSSVIDQMLLNNHVEFTKNIDITSYIDGVRETLNPEGRAMPSVVWGHYEDGCSIRLLNPQTFVQPVYVMNATLQEFFHCMIGTNVYLTPPNSQGFAPHYDDIEAFVIQIEGQKRWKLYNPRTSEEALARFSSQNFTQDEIGQPILDKVLKPGDVLYFPRGTIHQASTQPGYHSLHITVSMYQKHSYADLFEILLPKMMSRAIKSEIDLRRGLPLNLWQNMGKIFTGDEESKNEREEIMEKCEKLMQKVLRHADLDEAVDQMAKRFQHDALPPALTPAEKDRTIFGAKTVIDKNGRIQYGYDITLDTHVRLIRANVLRVVEEENSIRLYYYVDNSKEYHEYEPNFIEIEQESIGIVQQLVLEYPDYICISELEANSDDVKLSVVQGLYERGLLMVDEPSSN